jgi:hypothetical protein
MRVRVGEWIGPPNVSGSAGPTSSSMIIKTLGAPAAKWRTGVWGEYTESAMVGPALLPELAGAKGKLSPGLIDCGF